MNNYLQNVQCSVHVRTMNNSAISRADTNEKWQKQRNGRMGWKERSPSFQIKIQQYFINFKLNWATSFELLLIAL